MDHPEVWVITLYFLVLHHLPAAEVDLMDRQPVLMADPVEVVEQVRPEVQVQLIKDLPEVQVQAILAAEAAELVS
jgi:hypothetical protein